MRRGDAAAIVVGFLLLALLERASIIGSLVAGLAVGLLARGPAKGFFEGLTSGVFFAAAVTIAVAAGLVPSEFNNAYEYGFLFYYEYVANTTVCAVGGFIGGLVGRYAWTHRSTTVPTPAASADS